MRGADRWLALAFACIPAAACGPGPGAAAPPRTAAACVEVEGPGAVRFEVWAPGAPAPRATFTLDGAADAPGVRLAFVSCDDGARVHAEPADATAAFVWPRSAALRPGGAARFRVEALRDVVLPDGSSLHAVADRREVPRGPPARVDALQAWIDCASPAVGRRADDRRFLRVPPTAWWAFGEVAGRPAVARVGCDGGAFEPVSAGTRRLAAEPTVGGRPVPAGTLIAPARLDLAAAAAVRTLAAVGRCRAVAVRGDGEFAPVDLPAADVLTLWHPAFGVAYARWDDAGPRDASPEPCGVAFVADDGVPLTGHAAVWPAWPGTGEVFSRPQDAGLRLSGAAVDGIVFRGLPPGTYRYDHAVAPGAGPAPSVLVRGAVRLDGAAARRVVRVAPP